MSTKQEQIITEVNKNSIKNHNQEETKEEFGGYKGKEPTTYGDWQHKGRVTDF